jgi:hypothetical protein
MLSALKGAFMAFIHLCAKKRPGCLSSLPHMAREHDGSERQIQSVK